MLEVLVRGCIGEAEEAAALRGLPLVAVSTYHATHNETTVRVPTWCYAAVVAWYCEPQGPPYPAGTALYYNTKVMLPTP